MNINKQLRMITVMLLIFGLSACNDSGTGPGENNGEPPSIPQLSQEVLKVDISYFENASKRQLQLAETDNFNQARMFVTNAVGLLNFGTFLELANNKEADYIDGMWVWDYNYSQSGQSVSLKLTAEENSSSGTVAWALFISVSTPDEEINNYKFMEGTVAADGSYGQWQMNDYTSDARFVLDWSIESEDVRELSFTLYDEDDQEVGNATYSMDAPIYQIVWKPENTNEFLIHWNTDSMTGYLIDNENVKHCWDSNFQNIPCS